MKNTELHKISKIRSPQTTSINVKMRHAIGGFRGGASAPSQQDPILLFSHMFSPKSVGVGGWRPQRVGPPPQREILDSPLHADYISLEK